MKISKLIKQLQEAQRELGDHPMTTFDGFISGIKLSPAKDGICYPLKKGAHNEIGLEILTRWSA